MNVRLLAPGLRGRRAALAAATVLLRVLQMLPCGRAPASKSWLTAICL